MPGVQDPPEAEAPRKYGAHQSQIYADGLLKNILPTVTTDPNKLEEQAKKALGSRSYNYVAGGAGERARWMRIGWRSGSGRSGVNITSRGQVFFAWQTWLGVSIANGSMK